MTGRTLSSEKFVQSLMIGSICYLALPYIIFFMGWLRPEWGWSLTGLLIVSAILIIRGYYQQIQNGVKGDEPELVTITVKQLIFLCSICLAILLISGVGGYGYQETDWNKHNTLFRDLIEKPWPVGYQYYNQPVLLSYYIAYYLPSAYIGRIFGWSLATQSLFIWTYMGLALAIGWFVLLVGQASSKSILLFFCFSGLDLIGRFVISLIHMVTLSGTDWLEEWRRLETWSHWQYNANLTHLFWTPNHVLAGWILGGIIFYTLLYLSNRSSLLFLLGISILWSPFVTLAIAPLVVWSLTQERGTIRDICRRYISIPNLFSLGSLLMIGIYYATKFYGEVTPFLNTQIEHGFVFSLLPNNLSLSGVVALIVAIYILEFGLLAFALYPLVTQSSNTIKSLFGLSILWLCLLPLYKVGSNHDLALRASIPSLFLLAILVGRVLSQENQKSEYRLLLWLIVIGAATPVVEISRHVVQMVNRGTPYHMRSIDSSLSIAELYEAEPHYIRQYVSTTEFPYLDLFFKEPKRERGKQNRYISFNGEILLVKHEIDRHRLNAGDTTQVILRLRSLKEMKINYTLSLRLVGSDGVERWSSQSYPSERPTSKWEPFKNWNDTRTVNIPLETPPGIYRLELSFADPDTWDVLPALSVPEGHLIGPLAIIDYLEIGKIDAEPKDRLASAFQLGNQIKLLGTDLTSDNTLSKGSQLVVHLSWEAVAPMTIDYTGFIHMVDGQGNLVTQDDHQPLHGFLPTSLWRPGLRILDRYQLTIPSDVASGPYTLYTGMYDLETNQRLPIERDGQPSGDAIQIGTIQIE